MLSRYGGFNDAGSIAQDPVRREEGASTSSSLPMPYSFSPRAATAARAG